MDGTNKGEAERWLYTANKLLSARDLHSARSFAIRARESDLRFEATELFLAGVDTLLAGEVQIKEHLDYYAILQTLRYTQNFEYIAVQYRRLAVLLDPHQNPFALLLMPFSLVHDVWSVFSNPHKKALYDEQLHFLTQPPQPHATTQQPRNNHKTTTNQTTASLFSVVTPNSNSWLHTAAFRIKTYPFPIAYSPQFLNSPPQSQPRTILSVRNLSPSEDVGRFLSRYICGSRHPIFEQASEAA